MIKPKTAIKETRQRSPRTTLPPDRATLLEMAACPETPPSRLLSILKMADPELDALVAGNPNTPKKALHKLWVSYPTAALENPILFYWGLSEGRSIHALLPMPVKLSLYCVLRQRHPFGSLEEHLPEHERASWFANGGGAFDLSSAAESFQPNPQEEAVQSGRKTLHKDRLEYLFRLLSTDPCDSLRRGLARTLDDLSFPPAKRTELMLLLAEDSCWEVRKQLALSRYMDSVLHARLAEDSMREVRRTLATNKTIPRTVPAIGWKNLIYRGLGKEVFQNPACPEEVKIEVACSDVPGHRRLVWAGLRFHEISNRPPLQALIERLFTAPDGISELVQIARNQTIGGTLKSRLIAHGDVRITRAVATQTHLTEDQRLKLLFHADAKTALRAARHAAAADFLEDAAGHPDPLVRAFLARKKGDKTWGLRAKLVDDPDPRVRAALCRGIIEQPTESFHFKEQARAILRKYRQDWSAEIRRLARSAPRLGFR